MKKIHIIVLLCILLCCNSCRSSKHFPSFSEYENRIAENISWKVDDFYDVYLRFPQSLDELNDFIWHIINAHSDFNFTTFESYLESDTIKDLAQYVEVIQFINDHKNELKMNIKKDKFTLAYKDGLIEIEKNICRCLKMPIAENPYFYKLNTCETFDSEGKLTQENYNDEFFELLNLVKSEYLKKHPKNKNVKKSVLSVFRYDKRFGLSNVCSQSEIDVRNSLYIKELSQSLDTFISKKEIDMIQIIILTPIENE